MPLSFCHSGKLGDLIYSLPVIRARGGGALYLKMHGEGQLNHEAANSALSLLQAQSFVISASLWQGEPIDINLDQFRGVPDIGSTNLASAHFLGTDTVPSELDAPWLSVDPTLHGRPVFARSGDHHGWAGLWEHCMSLLSNPLFVGTVEEHSRFEQQFGVIEHVQTHDLLALARVIAGCSIFVGNQSCPYALAEGLKVRAVLEVDPMAPNCIFERSNVLHAWDESVAEQLKSFLTTG